MESLLNEKKTEKVIFIGAFGVGKTVALNMLSDTPVINTDVKSREAEEQEVDGDKTTTTVGFDYGEWFLNNNRKVHLYGMPSQDRFNAIWDIIIPDSSAIVIWVHGNKEEGLEDCKKWLELIKKYGLLDKICVAVTRINNNNESKLDEYRSLIQSYQAYKPVITADPRERDSVIQAVLVALSTPT